MRVRSLPGCPAGGKSPKILLPGPESESGHSRLPVPQALTGALGGSTAREELFVRHPSHKCVPPLPPNPRQNCFF